MVFMSLASLRYKPACGTPCLAVSGKKISIYSGSITIMMKMPCTKRKEITRYLRVLVHNHRLLGDTAVPSIFLLLVCSGIQIFFLLEKNSPDFRFNKSFDKNTLECFLILFYLGIRTSFSTDLLSLKLVEVVEPHARNGRMLRPEVEPRLSGLQASALALSYPPVPRIAYG